jgi:putative ABC transport system permease protein
VAACTSEIVWAGTYQNLRDVVQAYGVDNSLADVYNDPADGLPLDAVANLNRDRRGVLVGPVLMHKHGWHVGQHIAIRGLDSSHITLDFIVMGKTPVLQAPNVIVFRRSLLDEAVKKTYNFDLANTASFLAVCVDGAKWITPVISRIDAEFHNSDAQTQTITESDAKANNVSAVGDLRPIICALCALVMITMLLAAANSIAMSARERVTEVAVMRALGFSAYRVMMLTLIEAAAVAAVGGAAGAGAAYALFRNGITIGAVVGNTGYMTVAPPVAILTVALVTALGVVSAAVPAVGAARISPALAVRHVV